MNIYYAKSILYAYPNIDAVIGQIDDLVEKRALASMSDFSPAYSQCEKIVSLTVQKEYLLILKEIAGKVIGKLTDDEIDCFDYKYFKLKPKSYYENFDSTSRAYFRKQIKYAKNFADKMEKAGLTDERFEKEYLSIEFFKELLKRVKEYETLSYKNKSKKDKPYQNKELVKKSA